MRILLYTGKGGVGKTSVAAATALRLSKLGYRTIILSTDAAHSLADSLDTTLGPEPVEIAPKLWGQEVDVLHEIDRNWERVQEYVTSLLSWQGMEGTLAAEMSVLPGSEELAGLLRIIDHRESGQFDVVIVDCAPTAETLRLLSFPEMGEWWLQKIFPIQKAAAKVIRPIMRTMTSMPMPKDEIFDAVKHLMEQLQRIHDILADPEESAVRIVLNAEKMVVKEAQRIYTYLNLFGYATDLVICNRVIPDEVTDPYFAAWKDSQRRYLGLIDEAFSPVPILKGPFFDQEVVGLPMLARMGAAVYGDRDPATIFYTGRPQEVKAQRGGKGYVLSLPLPLVNKSDINLLQSGDELIVQVGWYKRNIILPRVLTNLSPNGAHFEDGRLVINFN